MNVKKVLAFIICKIAYAMAMLTRHTAASWVLYQTKVPDALKKEQ